MNQNTTPPLELRPEMEDGERLYEIHCAFVAVEHPGSTLPWPSLSPARRRQWRKTAEAYRMTVLREVTTDPSLVPVA